MNERKKHIVLVDADALAQARFNTFFSKSEVEVNSFASAMGAIQHIKQSGEPDLLLIEENVKPLGAIQTLNYLKEQVNSKGSVMLITNSESLVSKSADFVRFLSKPFKNEDIGFVKTFLQLPCSPEEPEEQIYSLNYLIELSDGDAEFIRESISIFKDSVTPRLEEMLQFYKEEAYEEVSKVAHSLKPSFEMLQNSKAAQLSNELAHKITGTAMFPLINELIEEHKKMQEALKDDFPEVYSV